VRMHACVCVEVTARLRARTHEDAREEVWMKVCMVVTAAREKVQWAGGCRCMGEGGGSGWRWGGGVVVASGEEVASEMP
jgi:hypothetical protein